MKNLFLRSISGIVYVLLVFVLLIVGGAGLFFLFLFLNILALSEFYNLAYKNKSLPYKFIGILTGGLIYSLAFLVAASLIPEIFWWSSLILLPLLTLPPLFYKPDWFYNSWISSIAGIIYISLPFALVPFIAYSTGTYNYELILGIFILIWIYDSFAYLTGMSIGKNKLYPSVSPKKTWEGAIGGAIFAAGSSLLLEKIFGIFNPAEWIIIALIVVIFGTLGDLLQSALKRNAGVKDSGNIMPGHGGVFDRLDSFIFSVPFIFLYLYLIDKIM